MDRFAITIRPGVSEEGMLRVHDAMQQVIDALVIFGQAEHAMSPDRQILDWRLEKASTNSPFTVVALAGPMRENEDISGSVLRVKSEVSTGLKNLLTRGSVAPWMDLRPDGAIRRFLRRNQNGIGFTDIDFMEGESLSIDRAYADAGMQALDAITIMDVASRLDEREAFGEVEGVMVAAGRFQRKPAIQIRSEYYGFVWCVLSEKIIEKFGTEHHMKDVWDGKNIGVEGVLSYAVGAKLSKITVHEIREITSAPYIDLDAILDPNFTSGLSPTDYLDLLHEGELA